MTKHQGSDNFSFCRVLGRCMIHRVYLSLIYQIGTIFIYKKREMKFKTVKTEGSGNIPVPYILIVFRISHLEEAQLCLKKNYNNRIEYKYSLSDGLIHLNQFAVKNKIFSKIIFKSSYKKLTLLMCLLTFKTINT